VAYAERSIAFVPTRFGKSKNAVSASMRCLKA
jgi:hypothetical protein